ncbi:MAG: hypothetical protein COY40_01935 [Alphaproteobacteria bacterium CG_4_10_14_0_8_um_filter_53_9]|nr:MAG: hypothetical protein COY40_01935 [Alphaproteobacteria bacterium CG_4_10_14_0_8_um_filter_53_9]
MVGIYVNSVGFIADVIAAATKAGKLLLFINVKAAGEQPISFSFDAFINGVHTASYVLACREGEMAAKILSDAAKAKGDDDFFGTKILPKMEGMQRVDTCRELRDAAWEIWLAINTAKDIRDTDDPCVIKTTNFALELWGDNGEPFTSIFFWKMIADGEGSRDGMGPFLLLDVASVLTAHGHDPSNLDRFEAAGMDKAWQYHPMADNVASHAVLAMAVMGILKAT